MVASSSGTPTGTVTCYDGGTALGSGTLDSIVVATFSTSSLSAGSHRIFADIPGIATLSRVPLPRSTRSSHQLDPLGQPGRARPLPVGDSQAVVFVLQTLPATATGPDCGHASNRVHSRYQCLLTDLPTQGRAVHVQLWVKGDAS